MTEAAMGILVDSGYVLGRLEGRELPEDFEEKLAFIFRVTQYEMHHEFLYAHNEATKFTVALYAALSTFKGEDKDRLNWEMLILRSLRAAQDGVPVDWERLRSEEYESIGLRRVWDRVTREPIVERGEKELLNERGPELRAADRRGRVAGTGRPR